jgi:uncharacterized membrane protein
MAIGELYRKELDAIAEHYQLSPAAIAVALDLAGARPKRDEIVQFVVRVVQLAGVLSLAAGVVFFIAANWAAFHVFGRFVLIEALLAASVGIALWKTPPNAVGRYALLMAFILTGVLLALFGQTYQTGADVYELFLTWTVLGLLFAIAAQWSVAWGAWTFALNVAFALFCGWQPQAGWFWVILADWDLALAELLLGPVLLNLLLWALCEYLSHTQWEHIAPRWLGRFVLACAFAFGTWAGVVAIFGSEFSSRGDPANDALVLIVLIGIFVAVAIYTLRQRRDVFPLALMAGSLIVLTTSGLIEHIDFDEIGIFFILALWLIASSTASGRLLMSIVRAWRADGDVA